MKRLLALISCVVVVTSPMALAQKETMTLPKRPQFREETEFRDIPQTHWARSVANQLARVGIMEGDSNGRFNGDSPLQRADFATVLSRLNSRLSSPVTIPEWAKEQKRCFTRYEFAVALNRVSRFIQRSNAPFSDSEPPGALNQFRDIPQTHWARVAANKIAGLGIMEGDLQGHFNGNSLLTRYEFAVALIRYPL